MNNQTIISNINDIITNKLIGDNRLDNIYFIDSTKTMIAHAIGNVYHPHNVNINIHYINDNITEDVGDTDINIIKLDLERGATIISESQVNLHLL
jgi:hypothetical protein